MPLVLFWAAVAGGVLAIAMPVAQRILKAQEAVYAYAGSLQRSRCHALHSPHGLGDEVDLRVPWDKLLSSILGWRCAPARGRSAAHICFSRRYGIRDGHKLGELWAS